MQMRRTLDWFAAHRKSVVAVAAVIALGAASYAVLLPAPPDDPQVVATVEGTVAEPSRPFAPPGDTDVERVPDERSDRADQPLEGRRYAPDTTIVALDPSLGRSEAGAFFDSEGLEILDRTDDGSYLVATGDQDPRVVGRRLSSLPEVLYAEPDHIFEASTTDDPLIDRLWGLNNTGQSVAGSTGTSGADIGAFTAWEVATGSSEVTVAVVDSGVAYDHPDLEGRIWTNPGESGNGRETNGLDDDGNGYVDDWRGWDWVDDDGDPRDLNGHGTHVAGTIGAEANNGVGISGVAQDVSVVALRTLDATGSGRSSDIAAAFHYAGKMGVDIVNASLGGSGFSQSMLDSIGAWPDTLFVVAAGNEATDVDVSPTYPCAYPSPNLICVAATTSSDALASFSNYGAVQVDLGAPGRIIASAIPALVHPFQEGFEDDWSGRWTATGSWSASKDQHGAFVSDGVSVLPANLDMALSTTAPFSLERATGCQLSYATRIDLRGSGDRLVIEAQRSGDTTWTLLDAWKGSSQGQWTSLSSDLSSFDGAEVRLRFRLVTADSPSGSGIDLDDIDVGCASTSYTSSSYGYMSGTSMATPHVAGAAALLLALDPSLTPTSTAQILSASAEKLSSLVGKTVTGGRLDVAAAFELLGGSRSAPEPSAQPTTEAPSPVGAEPPPPAEEEQDGPDASPDDGSPSPPPVSPEASTEPDASPSPSPEPREGEVGGSEHERSIGYRLKRHLVAVGRVKVATGFSACVAEVPVRVVRKGKVIARSVTDAEGRFKIRLPDRPGRYRVVAPALERPPGTQQCLGAVKTRRHLH